MLFTMLFNCYALNVCLAFDWHNKMYKHTAGHCMHLITKFSSYNNEDILMCRTFATWLNCYLGITSMHMYKDLNRQ